MEEFGSKTIDKTAKNQTDEVITEIEKFIHEYDRQNVPKMSQGLARKRPSVDSDKDLINILCDSQSHQCAMPPKKRKYPSAVEAKSKKKEEEKRRGEAKGRRILKAQTKTYIPPQFRSCKSIVRHRKRKIDRTISHESHKHKAKVIVVKTHLDSKIVRQVTLKKEVIDLTCSEETFFTFLRFANEHEFYEEETKPFDIEIGKATVINDLTVNEVTIFVPQVEVHIVTTLIDLTQCDHPTVVCSEKECASKIIDIVYSCHKIIEATQRMIGALDEIRNFVPPEQVVDDHFHTNIIILKHLNSLSSSFASILSTIFVKNLNLTRFLDIVSTKLNLQCGVSLPSETICCYLYSMFNSLGDIYLTGIAEKMRQQINEHMKTLQMKQEHGHANVVVFTQEQLSVLWEQICQFKEIVESQQNLSYPKVEPKSEVMRVEDGTEIQVFVIED